MLFIGFPIYIWKLFSDYYTNTQPIHLHSVLHTQHPAQQPAANPEQISAHF